MKPTITPTLMALETAWRELQERHPDLPHAVILTAPASKRGLLGHFAHNRWLEKPTGGVGEAVSSSFSTLTHEVLITSESLARTPKQVFCTLVHEAAHALNNTRGVKDVSSNQYHNKNFKKAAEEMGLTVERSNGGWSTTTIPKETVEDYQFFIDGLAAQMRIYRHDHQFSYTGGGKATGKGAKETGEGTTKKKGSSRMLKATCGCGHIIRMSKKVFEATEAAGITCGECQERFSLDD